MNSFVARSEAELFSRLKVLLFCQTRVKRCHPLRFMAVFTAVLRSIGLVIQTKAVGILHHKLHHLPMGLTSKELFQVMFKAPVTDRDHFVGPANSSFHLHAAFSFGSGTPDPEYIFPHPEKPRAIACQKTVDKHHRLWLFRQIDLVNGIAFCTCHLQTPLQYCYPRAVCSTNIIFTKLNIQSNVYSI